MKFNFSNYVFRLFLLTLFSLIPTHQGKAINIDTPSAPIIYVDADAVGLENGSSWANAYRTLQDALAQPPTSGDQIWVAEGIYYPDEGGGQSDGDQNATFTLINGVSVLGGFNGTETEASQRDPATNITVLSGDIDDQNDDTDAYGIINDPSNDIHGNNSYHVTTGSSTNDTAILDGFTITAGNVGSGFRGAGMKLVNSSPTLENLVFAGNRAGNGGGLSNKNGNPTLSNVEFIANFADEFGGGMYNFDGSAPILTDVFFSGNDANIHGGGLYNEEESNAILRRVVFSGNKVTGFGGGMYNDHSIPTLTEVTFSQNEALSCGGLMIDNSQPNSTTLTNVTFSDNQADNVGGGMCNYQNSSATLMNVIFKNNSADKGGGIIIEDSNQLMLMTNVSFQGNSADDAGGGIYIADSTNVEVYNALISGNKSNEEGGGLFSDNSTLLLVNDTFSSNYSGTNGGGIYIENGTYLTIQNSINWRNRDSSGMGTAHSSIFYTAGNSVSFQYCLTQGWNPAGNGNLDGTNVNNRPLFWISISPTNAPTTEGDFRLQNTSPAIDVGNNDYITGISTDLAGGYRIINQIVDLGAYEANGNIFIPLVMR